MKHKERKCEECGYYSYSESRRGTCIMGCKSPKTCHMESKGLHTSYPVPRGIRSAIGKI